MTAHDVAFHRRLIGAGRSAYAQQVWTGAESRIRMQFARVGQPERRLLAIADEHRVLLDVLRGGDDAAVDDALEQHIVAAAEMLLVGDGARSVPAPAAEGRPRHG